jgi:penicillin amidase
MQSDIYSEHAAALVEVLLPLLRNSGQGNEFETVLPYLENWDFQYRTNSTAATIFDLFFLNLSNRILERDIPDNLLEGIYRQEDIPVRIVTKILTDGGSYFNIADEETEEFRLRTVRSAMAETIRELTEQLGPEPFAWRWESLHTLTLRPPLLGEISDNPDSPKTLGLIVRNLLSEGPHPVPGHGMTINKSEYSWTNPFAMTLGPSIRRIVDFSEPYRSLSVLPTGQSGNPLSANYGDQTDLWLDGRYRYIYSDSTFFKETNVETMKLEPLSVQ